MTDDEARLAVELELPIFGSDPALNRFGTKKGSRSIFEEEDVPHPVGFELDGPKDVAGALRELRKRRPEARRAVLKLDDGVSGLGNAIVDLSAADGDPLASLQLEDEEMNVEEYVEALAAEGGIVEERIEGERVQSPSVQLRMSPAGQVDVMSTHDQILGGRYGQTYFGCHFPADPDYAQQIAAEGLKVGQRLAREGAIGRASVDFVAVQGTAAGSPTRSRSTCAAAAPRTRCSRSPTLTDGAYDALAGEYRTG